MKKTVLNTVLSTAFIVALGAGVSACSGGEEHEEVLAIDMVDEAAELARANAPEAEDMEFPETSATAVADNATAADEAGATESEAMSVEQEITGDTQADSADTAAAPAATDSADMATPEDAAATPAE
ncbi:hypothetical protein [Psychrobacter piscatorii]|uniref:hypothetical protein n=1 Tax=Psychrobacter piscatorii TaxID=554343 RepID=UPI003734D956